MSVKHTLIATCNYVEGLRAWYRYLGTYRSEIEEYLTLKNAYSFRNENEQIAAQLCTSDLLKEAVSECNQFDALGLVGDLLAQITDGLDAIRSDFTGDYNIPNEDDPTLILLDRVLNTLETMIEKQGKAVGWFPATFYDKHCNISSDRLRQSYKRNKLPHRVVRNNSTKTTLYPFAVVRQLWPLECEGVEPPSVSWVGKHA